ncbi:MAG: hypothetical protein JHD02_02950 [Thermoleophilaceae bacterium]|nr:hypothetical protein [Thermoleophilaceae bacterium]
MSAKAFASELLPAEQLIADRRNDAPAAELESAPSLRLAAAEVVREGYLLHYSESRWYAISDPDLALLAGDRMYAAGLAALAAEGDTVAVGALAALIAGCAEAHAVGESARADELWESTLAMLAPGSD